MILTTRDWKNKEIFDADVAVYADVEPQFLCFEPGVRVLPAPYYNDPSIQFKFKAKHEPGAGELKSPIKGEMTGKVNESLQGILQVSFFQGDKCLFRDRAEMAGLEVAGDVPNELFI